MSSFSDMMSSAIAMMMSAAFVHFGVTGGTPPAHKDTAPPPAIHASAASSSATSEAPIPSDDDRFDSDPPAGAMTHSVKLHHTLQ